MTYILVHAAERFDHSDGKVMKFLFHDTTPDMHHFKIDVPEGSDHWNKWYSLFLSAVRASKENHTLRLSNITTKGVVILPESDFKYEILTSKTPKEVWTPPVELPKNPNAKKYILKGNDA